MAETRKPLKKIALRCYARKLSPGRHVAVCLTLNLVAQGTTQNQAIHKLHALIKAYIKDAVRNDELDAFVPRPAPARYYCEYLLVLAACTLSTLRSRFYAFTDHHPIPAHA